MTFVPIPLEELVKLDGDDLVRELWVLIDGHKKRSSDVTRRGRIDLDDIFWTFYGQKLTDMEGTDFPDRATDALATLCERGYVWFKMIGAPWAIGQKRAAAQYEFTPKGRTATLEEITSGWPSGRAVLERFPEHAAWDETMGAYFRLAVRTYEARVYEAAVFLLGGAAERLLVLVGDKVGHLIPNWSKKQREAKDRQDVLAKLFRERDITAAEAIEIIGNTARWARNDVGHPKVTPPTVKPVAVLAMITWFPEHVETLFSSADAIR